MQKFKILAISRLAVFIGGVVLTLGVAWTLMGTAQDKKAHDPNAHAQPKVKQPPDGQNLASQLADLQVRVDRLAAAFEKTQASGMIGMAGKPSGRMEPVGGTGGTNPSMGGMSEDASKMAAMGAKNKPAGSGMTGMKEMKGMGAMGSGKAGMANKKPVGGEAMTDDDMKGGTAGKKASVAMMDGDLVGGAEDMDAMEKIGMMGMAPNSGGGMGGTKGMDKMQMQAALPGFPGASHIYHVGAVDFFLNHPDYINLNPKQKGDLGRLKEKAVLAKNSAQRKVDEAEQQLWTLTSVNEPDSAQIEAKIQEIEKLRGDKRRTLIWAVSAAAKILTDEQRQALLGTGADETTKPDPHAGHKP